MKKYLLIFLTAVAFMNAQEIIESNTIATVLPLIDEDTWFLIDLDNTLFQAKQAFGHVNWFQSEVQKQILAGKSKEEAFHSLYPLWKKTQGMTEVMPVEESFIEAIKELQLKSIVVMGVTHRQLFIVSETLCQLDSLGVSFLKTAPTNESFMISAKQPALYTEGILFVDDFNSKGDIFRSLLKLLGKKPKKVVFIDDKKKNVEELAKSALSEGIEYIGVYYTAVQEGEQIYTPELAEVQHNFFNTILSNEQALQLLSHENKEKKMGSTPEYLYKIVSREEWEKSLLKDQIVLSSLDENFIHLANEEQLQHVLQKFWKDKDSIILKLETGKIVGRLSLETNPGGTNKYYHLYDGSIPLTAVVEVTINHNP